MTFADTLAKIVTDPASAVASLAELAEPDLLELEALSSTELDAAYAAGDQDTAGAVAMIRGWILDALEINLGAERFEAWIDDQTNA